MMLTINASEFLLTAGRTRIAVGQDANGVATATPLIEWFMTISMNAPIAKMLAKALDVGIKNYEDSFGKIPEDPAAKLILGGPGSQK